MIAEGLRICRRSGESDILLLDEPSTYLDIPAQLELLDLLKSLTRQGKIIIMVFSEKKFFATK